MATHAGDIVLTVHFLWLMWMISGVGVALAGFVWPRVWGWRVFRVTHLIALLATATVPFWAERGLCPLTLWEWSLDQQAESGPQPLLIRLMSEILYWDASPWAMSIATGFAALLTVVVFVARPPWRYRTTR